MVEALGSRWMIQVSYPLPDSEAEDEKLRLKLLNIAESFDECTLVDDIEDQGQQVFDWSLSSEDRCEALKVAIAAVVPEIRASIMSPFD